MADELDPVELQFIADVEEALAAMQALIDEARGIADSAVEAKAGLDEMRDGAAGAAVMIADLRDHAAEAAGAVGDYRDKAAEAGAADHGLRDSAIEAGAALGHVRDEALLAAAAIHEMRDASISPLSDVSRGLDDVAIAAEDAAGALGGGGGGGGLGGMMIPLIALAGTLAAILAGPLVAGLFAVGASIGALAIVAIPVFKDISAFFTATSATARAKAWKAMDPAEQGITRHLQDLMHTFDQISKAVMPSVVQMFGDALKVVDALMPSLKPLAEGAAKAFGSLFNNIAQWLNGPSGQKFLHWLDTEGPKAMQDFTSALWITMQIVGRTFSLLRTLGDQWFQHFAQGLHDIRVDFDNTRHAIADFAHNVAAHFDELRHDIADWAHNVAAHFDEVRHDIATWAHDVAHDFDEVRHTIASWAHDVASTFDEVRHWIAAKFDQIRQDIRNWVNDVINFFRRLPGDILSALGNLGSLLVSAGRSLISGLISGIENAVPGLHSALSWVSSLIPSWKGPLDKDAVMLYPHGQAIIGSLIHGMLSALPQLEALLAHVTDIAGLRGAGGGTAGLSLAGVGGYGSLGGPAAIGAAPVVVNVPVTVHGSMTPQALQGLREVVQEAILRYALLNQGNGIFLPGRLS
jgi:hypothetical protein